MSFEAFGVPVQLTVDEGELAARVHDRLPPGWRECAPTASARRFGLRRVDGDSYEVTVDGRTQLYQAALDVAVAMLDAEIRLYIATNAREHVFVHAGVVASGERALVIPGKSFSGKSTLVKALVEAGATYYSDEYAVVDRTGRVHPYPRRLSLRVPAGRQESDIAELGGVAGDVAAELALVVITHYRSDSDWNPARVTNGRGLAELLANCFPAQQRPQESLTVLNRAISRVVCVLEGNRGEAGPVAEALLAELTAATCAGA